MRYGKAKRQDTSADSQKETIQKLKAICRGQQKELGRLRKELDRREDVGEELKEALEEVDEVKRVPQQQLCPKCNNGTQETPLGAKFKLIQCSSCDWRTKVDK